MATIKNVFKCSILSSKFLMPNGKELPFVNGEYLTDIKGEIDYLNTEIAAGHPYIYIDAAKVTVDADITDPLEEVRRKAVADYIAAMSAATDKSNDMGNSTQGAFVAASTSTVADGAAGSDSQLTSVAQQIATLVPATKAK